MQEQHKSRRQGIIVVACILVIVVVGLLVQASYSGWQTSRVEQQALQIVQRDTPLNNAPNAYTVVLENGTVRITEYMDVSGYVDHAAEQLGIQIDCYKVLRDLKAAHLSNVKNVDFRIETTTSKQDGIHSLSTIGECMEQL